MNYIKSLKVLDIDARQLPCVLGNGAPTTETAAAVGDLYMDLSSETRDIYKCVEVSGGIYYWAGIYNERKNGLRLINKITLSEDAELYSVDLDSDGKAFSVQPFYVVFNLMPDFETATTRSLSLRMTTDRYERFLCMSTVTFATDYVGVMGVLKAEIIGGITVSEVKKYTYKSSILAGKMSFSPFCAISNNMSNPIKAVDVYLYDNNARKKVTLKAGSTIELWGCDYENLS